jgi:hypothetical protein
MFGGPRTRSADPAESNWRAVAYGSLHLDETAPAASSPVGREARNQLVSPANLLDKTDCLGNAGGERVVDLWGGEDRVAGRPSQPRSPGPPCCSTDSYRARSESAHSSTNCSQWPASNNFSRSIAATAGPAITSALERTGADGAGSREARGDAGGHARPIIAPETDHSRPPAKSTTSADARKPRPRPPRSLPFSTPAPGGNPGSKFSLAHRALNGKPCCAGLSLE